VVIQLTGVEKQLVNLEVSVEDARLIVHGFKARPDYSATKDRLFTLLEPLLPACATNSTLQKLSWLRINLSQFQ
jgi:hypothetical protein